MRDETSIFGPVESPVLCWKQSSIGVRAAGFINRASHTVTCFDGTSKRGPHGAMASSASTSRQYAAAEPRTEPLSKTAGASWTNLTNSAPYSGATTATLTVAAGVVLNGSQYRCVATNSRGAATSQVATLTVIIRSTTGDFDNDHKTDLAVYPPSTGVWYIKQSSASYATYTSYQWGLSTDLARPGDYDGDGKTDLGVYRPSTGMWYVLQSSTNYTTFLAQQWGLRTDLPLAGDYDGDRRIDPAVYRPSSGVWHILQSTTNYATSFAQQWGLSTVFPGSGRQAIAATSFVLIDSDSCSR